ncbi:hypothetical protein IWX46DRAFT_625884 [Phyllosticta citricarpa]|uniref:Uncharacterized protein n=1 Tax=Phyllosticta citricarpa TaxID=55181 RepID=A0ABR1MH67_9PEZI
MPFPSTPFTHPSDGLAGWLDGPHFFFNYIARSPRAAPSDRPTDHLSQPAGSKNIHSFATMMIVEKCVRGWMIEQASQPASQPANRLCGAHCHPPDWMDQRKPTQARGVGRLSVCATRPSTTDPFAHLFARSLTDYGARRADASAVVIQCQRNANAPSRYHSRCGRNWNGLVVTDHKERRSCAERRIREGNEQKTDNIGWQARRLKGRSRAEVKEEEDGVKSLRAADRSSLSVSTAVPFEQASKQESVTCAPPTRQLVASNQSTYVGQSMAVGR